jgi:hypothetical protein
MGDPMGPLAAGPLAAGPLAVGGALGAADDGGGGGAAGALATVVEPPPLSPPPQPISEIATAQMVSKPSEERRIVRMMVTRSTSKEAQP